MAFNPTAEVALARDFAKKFNKEMVIVISFDDENIRYDSFGRTEELCALAEKFAETGFAAVHREALWVKSDMRG